MRFTATAVKSNASGDRMVYRMKLKNVLMITFLTLTIIPIAIVSLLLYKSGYELSKESYTRNLIESLNVQADYISQTIENNMILDYRFANQNIAPNLKIDEPMSTQKSALYTAITSYLGTAEDKITVCILLDRQNVPIYSIGEKAAVDAIGAQVEAPSALTNQAIMEFDLDDGTHSLGIVTPVWDKGAYIGCLVSVYDKSYIFKIISSYYEIADTATYICRENGDIISSRQLPDKNSDGMQQILRELTLAAEGAIDTRIENTPLSGYYKNIHNTPWYLIGFVDTNLIYSFTNRFLAIYILVILGVLLVDIILSFYFSRRVVKPINSLIKVMEGYQNSLDGNELQYQEESGYVETKYLRTKFLELMKKILLVQHNFEGVYQLYQSNDMDDTNIDIDVTNQTISCNKALLQNLISTVEVPAGACIVEKFTHCFCEKDQRILMTLFEEMRDEHLSVTREVEVYTPYLEKKWFHTMVVPMYTNERLSRLFVQLRDVSSFKKQELKSNEQAKRDALTGLYNRAGFTSCVGKALQAGSSTDLHALLFIDMDYFKLVNDNFGHIAGDELLRSVGKMLLNTVGADGIVSRFGGDEFAVFLTQTSSVAIATMERTLKEQLVFPFRTEHASFIISASIGVSTWVHDSPSTLEDLLQQADSAMYQSKRTFKQQQEAGA